MLPARPWIRAPPEPAHQQPPLHRRPYRARRLRHQAELRPYDPATASCRRSPFIETPARRRGGKLRLIREKAPARLFHPTDRTTARDATIATPRQAPDDSKEGMELVQYGGSERNVIVRFDDVAMIVSARQAAHHHDPGQAAKRQGPAKDVYMTATGTKPKNPCRRGKVHTWAWCHGARHRRHTRRLDHQAWQRYIRRNLVQGAPLIWLRRARLQSPIHASIRRWIRARTEACSSTHSPLPSKTGARRLPIMQRAALRPAPPRLPA